LTVFTVAVEAGFLHNLSISERVGMSGVTGHTDLVMTVVERTGHKHVLGLKFKHAVTQPGQQGDAQGNPTQLQNSVCRCLVFTSTMTQNQ
jgi:hypothetical protein